LTRIRNDRIIKKTAIKRIFMHRYILVLLLIFFSPVSLLSAQSSLDPDPVVTDTTSTIVKSIEVKGNKAISIATILSKIKTRVGQEYLQSVISDDLKRLYNTGYFSDVRVDRQDYKGGFKVIIYLDEKAIVEEITFSKTRFIRSKALLKKMKTQEGKFLNNAATHSKL